MQLLPENDNAMSFLTKNNLVFGTNDLLGDITTWVSYNVTFDCNGEIINDDDTEQERDIVSLGTLTSDY